MGAVTATQTFTATVAASGAAVVTIRTGSRRRRWVISQVSVEMATAPVGATCAVRLNGALISPVIPTGDSASGDPPVTVEGSDTMTVEWAGCTPGAVGTVLIIYDEQST
jgi:hypothetical protein